MKASDPIARTLALADALGLTVDRATLDAVLGAGGLDPQLVEWSVNAGDDPRAPLRFGAWVDGDDPALAQFYAERAGPDARALRDATPHDGLEGLGLALDADGSRLRWWQLAGDEGRALHAVAATHDQGVDALAARCGGPARCRALGAELAADGSLRRTTAYYSVLTPAVALDVLEHLAVPSSLEGKQLLAGLCGLDGKHGLPWPKVWIGRSMGSAGAGHKLYVFLRGAERRPSDAAVMALTQSPAVERARAAFGGPECAIPIVGLTWPTDGGAPRWTVYLADR